MKYHVINLEYATDRLENINQYFNNNKLEYEVCKAIDGKNLILNNGIGYFTSIC